MPQLQEVFEAVVLSSVLYVVQSWGGYAFSVDIENLQKLFVKAKRWRLVNVDYSLTDMLANGDKTLFKAEKCGKHCLKHWFTLNIKNVHRMSLHTHDHSFILPLLKFTLARNSIVNWSLFSCLVKTCCNWMFCNFYIVTQSDCLAKIIDLLTFLDICISLTMCC